MSIGEKMALVNEILDIIEQLWLDDEQIEAILNS